MKNSIKVLIITILSIALLAGCSGKKTEKDSKEEASENISESISENISDVVSVEDAKKSVGSLINSSNYTISEQEDGTESYSFRSDLFKDYNLRFVLSVDNDSNINMPESCSGIMSSGWKFTNPAYDRFNLEPKKTTNVQCEKNGKFINVFVKNNTENNVLCSQALVSRVMLELYSKEDGYKEKLASAPDFKIGNSIDGNTDMKGIISAVGEPSKITFSRSGSTCADITFLYQNTGNRDYLKFVLSPDGKKIVSVDYSVG